MVGTIFLLVFLLVGSVLLLAAFIALLIEVVQRRRDLARHPRWIFLSCTVILLINAALDISHREVLVGVAVLTTIVAIKCWKYPPPKNDNKIS